ncbi:hypothetical protein RBH89_18405 [Paracidovorax avenae]
MSAKLKYHFAIFTFAFLISGCAAPAFTNIDKTKITPFDGTVRTIEIIEPIESPIGKIAAIVMPGKYTSKLQDSEGIYFIGTVKAIAVRTVRDDYFVDLGGVWVPNDEKVAPRVFIMEQGNTRRGKTLDEAMNANVNNDFSAPIGIALLSQYLLKQSMGDAILFHPSTDIEATKKLRNAFFKP